ncbi:PilZ domain-containing protein [Undibacterium sp. 14-3-2]|uniref:PilZ domain-containing protein n=1 Tax=Undibacterium sp. 14-3-2 TaxID=2800129 RepID=UPI00190380A1|nr:PilZ domain-containing protein [Undibacterium sp. 14-3-2]MBK1889353.1 PilZ domain-containing protein [Undibacterium sp. 14-3-2]
MVFRSELSAETYGALTGDIILMIELRRAPRINVSWRCGIRMPDGHLLLCRAVNISGEGVLVQCPESLQLTQIYPMMIEIPGIANSDDIFRVACKGSVRHIILSGDHYHAGMHLTNMSDLHSELVNAWISRANKFAS